jgi:hypothetical protein
MLGTAVVLALVAVACGGAPATGGAPDVSGLDVLKAQSTIDAWNAIQATAQTEALAATRRAEEATAQAVQQTADAAAALATGTAVAIQGTVAAQTEATAAAQATAGAVAAQATATWDALMLDAQAVAIRQTADAGAYTLSATATADAAIAAFMRQEADAVIRERNAQAARREMWNSLAPWVVGGVGLTAVGVVFLLVGGYVIQQLRQSRPQRAGEIGFVVWGPQGPVAIAAPPPRPQLTARVEPPVDVTPAAGPEAAPIPLPVIDKGHMLIAGETDSGKSTAARLIAGQRGDVRVLDPHWNGRDWAGLEVIGGGRDFDAIRDSMDSLRELLRVRYSERLDGRDDFAPLTVFVDEMPAIVAALGRDVRDFWREWLREGRKVGLFLVLLTQSTRVRTLGIEGEKDVLENFGNVLVLGKLAVAEHPRLVEGMARPAVLRTMGSALPVVIPHVPDGARPSAAPTADGPRPAAADVPPPIIYATTEWPTRREDAPIDLNNIDGRARQRIVDEYRRTMVFRQVQLNLFPNYADDGGQAGQVIRRVLADAGMIERGTDGRWRPTVEALGYEA